MRKRREIRDHLKDIADAAAAIAEFLSGFSSSNQFEADRKSIFAVVRALEIMGEAAKRIPDGFRRKHSGIPWREMAGMRDKLIHEYFGVDTAVLWKTATVDVPPVREAMEELLASGGELPFP